MYRVVFVLYYIKTIMRHYKKGLYLEKSVVTASKMSLHEHSLLILHYSYCIPCYMYCVVFVLLIVMYYVAVLRSTIKKKKTKVGTLTNLP